MAVENLPVKKRGVMQKQHLRGIKKMKGSKSHKRELLKKLSSWKVEREEESQRQLANLISSCSGNVNKGIVDLVEEVCDMQGKLSAVTEERDQLLLTVDKLKNENGSLKTKVGVEPNQQEPEKSTHQVTNRDVPEVILEDDCMRKDRQAISEGNKEAAVEWDEPKDGGGSRDALLESENLTMQVELSRKSLSGIPRPRRVRLHEKGEKLKCAMCPYDSYYTSETLLRRHAKEVHLKIKSKSVEPNVEKTESNEMCKGQNCPKPGISSSNVCKTMTSKEKDGSAYGPTEPSYHPDGRRRRSTRFNHKDVDAAFAIMTELDPNNILSSGKWADGFKEEKENLLVAMHDKFSKVASRQVNSDQFKKFLSRIRTERKIR